MEQRFHVRSEIVICLADFIDDEAFAYSGWFIYCL